MIHLTRDDILLGNDHVIKSNIFYGFGLPEANISFLHDDLDDIISRGMVNFYYSPSDIPLIAAHYLQSIIFSLTFTYGKGRIAIFAVILFLKKNGYVFNESVLDGDLFSLAFETFERRFGQGEISNWIRDRIVDDWYDPSLGLLPTAPSMN
ncbi:MAG TPA: hypothetical protein VKR41_07890 [Puia sp.]|nr:hypothetical protein [Puia sp.]